MRRRIRRVGQWIISKKEQVSKEQRAKTRAREARHSSRPRAMTMTTVDSRSDTRRTRRAISDGGKEQIGKEGEKRFACQQIHSAPSEESRSDPLSHSASRSRRHRSVLPSPFWAKVETVERIRCDVDKQGRREEAGARTRLIDGKHL